MSWHLNLWVNAAAPWVNVARLQACGDPTLRETDFRGDDCYIGQVDTVTEAREFISVYASQLL